MKILIIEAESYLAASLANKLESEQFTCDIKSPAQALGASGYDVVLLSMSGFFDYLKLINTHKKSIIILLVNYISSDILEALKAGADDYILKPIIIEELRRKIMLLGDYKRLKILSQSYENIIQNSIDEIIKNKNSLKNIALPLCLISKERFKSDLFVCALAKAKGLSFARIKLVNDEIPGEHIDYFYDFENLSAQEKKQILNKQNKNIIIYSKVSQAMPNQIILDEQDAMAKIMQIEEYIKFCIISYQENYTDIEIANMLGVSRKLIWDKRRKHGITKQRKL